MLKLRNIQLYGEYLLSLEEKPAPDNKNIFYMYKKTKKREQFPYDMHAVGRKQESIPFSENSRPIGSKILEQIK